MRVAREFEEWMELDGYTTDKGKNWSLVSMALCLIYFVTFDV